MKRKAGLILSILSIALLCQFTTAEKKPVIYMIGDSTMADKPIEGGNPERGWGHALPSSFMGITIENHAKNGRSGKSFIDEGLWSVVEERMRPGDYLFIQFGHNDQKKDEKRYGAPYEGYSANLVKFIATARSKGATPVLFTSIVRRHFDGEGKLIDTHKEYIDAVKKVAADYNVPLVDLNAYSHEVVEKAGPKASKSMFVFVEPGTIAHLPKGKQDSTHLNVKGARIIARQAASELKEMLPALEQYYHDYDFVVAKDGSGDFFSVQDAVFAAPDYQKRPTSIFVREGEYRERVYVTPSKQNLELIGENAETTIISYDNYASKIGSTGEETGTFGTATLFIDADDFSASDITFANTAGAVGQAVAVMTVGDRMSFRRCRFLGNQDTLFTYGSHKRLYFRDCYIEGTTDFIFGASTALFENCTIYSKRNSFITAASTPEGEKYGYVFLDCRLEADPEFTKVMLGRPWRDYAKTVFIRCHIGPQVREEGWHNWKKPEREKTSYYAEGLNTGPGADTKGRVKWAHKLSKKEIEATYRPEQILAGKDGWDPR